MSTLNKPKQFIELDGILMEKEENFWKTEIDPVVQIRTSSWVTQRFVVLTVLITPAAQSESFRFIP